MSSKNDESSALFIALAFVGAAMMVFAAVIFAIFAFLAFVLTIIAFWAWNRPRRIGKHIIHPHEARSFVARGLIGVVALPVFAVFCSVLFNVQLNWDLIMPYLLLGGYVGGSIGIEMLTAEDEAQAEAVPPVQPPLPDTTRSLPRPAQEERSFEYASWDDEERT